MSFSREMASCAQSIAQTVRADSARLPRRATYTTGSKRTIESPVLVRDWDRMRSVTEAMYVSGLIRFSHCELATRSKERERL